MTEKPELCREAADMLSREVSFIQAALAERRRFKSIAAPLMSVLSSHRVTTRR
jgi:hypothetical protein